MKFGGADVNTANLGVIMSDVDRVIDLNIPKSALKDKKPAELQSMRPAGVGLLLLYPISRDSPPISETDKRESLDAIDDVLGVGIVFPKSSHPTAMRYKTNDLSKGVRETLAWMDDETISARQAN